jgi:anthranilate phosphoribosyltransferase
MVDAEAALKQALERVIAGESLSVPEGRAAFEAIMDGRAGPEQLAAFLVALRMRGETVMEVATFARVMRERVTPVRFSHPRLIDTCGTGGDGAGTFNVSTLAAFVVAAAGVPVAKHGNTAVSSRCGSADLLRGLGIRADVPAETAELTLREAGFGFLYAPGLHGSVRHAAAVRRALGVRTVFNLLGPLTNPAGARRQVLGVYDPAWVEGLAEVLRELGSERAMVVHGHGIDEIALHGETRIAELRDSKVTTYSFRPEDVGIGRAGLEAIAGGETRDNVAIALRVLNGERGAPRDIVLINAAAALVVADSAADFSAGIERAAEAIDSGAALRVVERLRALCPESAGAR